MKHLISLVVGIVFLFSVLPNAFCGDVKIGIVDLQKLQRDSKAFKALSEGYMRVLE